MRFIRRSSAVNVQSAPVDAVSTCAADGATFTLGGDILQLYVLSAFAIAQPLLDRLAGQVTFLIHEQIDARGLSMAIATVLFAVPTAVSLVEWIVGLLFGSRARRSVHRGFVCLLLLCLSLQIIQTVLAATGWRTWGVPGVLIVGLAAIAAYRLERSLQQSKAIRKAVSYAAAGIIVFPVMFCLKPGIREIYVPRTSSGETSIENPVPIVMVVFDGFNGMALLDERHEIDAARYPNFARLSETSHWFRNATTVHPRTGYAVPALLTGKLPRDVVPIASEYPQNLLQLIHDSRQYEMSVFEPNTQLAPRDDFHRRERLSTMRQAGDVLWHLGFIFLHATVPADIPPGLPRIPRSWFHLSEEARSFDDFDRTTGVFAYSWDVQRNEQFNHFLACIDPSVQPGFRFLHVVMPHHPWTYLPNGENYAPRMDVGDYPIGAHGSIGEDWSSDSLVVNLACQRYLFQLMFVDRLIGQLLDKLESSELMDECLLVVTADHGEAFIPGLSRREVVGENISEILPIPLFIKLPGQREGIVSDRNVESIDVFPTIADVVGLELQSEVDGRAIFDPEQPASLRKTFLSNWEPVAVSAEFPERYRSVDRMISLFGTGSRDDRLWTYSFKPELVGQPLENFRIEEGGSVVVKLYHGGGRYDPSTPNVVPCLLEGRVMNHHSGEPPRTLVFALNGNIVAVTRTLADDIQPEWFTVLAPQADFRTVDDFEVFEFSATDSSPVLRRCIVSYEER